MTEREIADELIREAQELEGMEERGERPSGPYHRPPKPRDPSQIYTLRIPVSRLGRLKEIAEEQGVGVSTLMRRWVLERLEVEELRSRAVDRIVRSIVREELERAGLLERAG